MQALLASLASADATEIAAGSQISEATIAEATRPLADAGWKHTIDGRSIRWQAPGDRPVSVQFDVNPPDLWRPSYAARSSVMLAR